MSLKFFGKSKKFFVVGSFMILFFFSICCAQAGFLKSDAFSQDSKGQGDIAAQAAGYESATNETLLQVVQTFINGFLSLIGVILIAYLLYAGYNWMTAQGEEEKVEKAKSTITRAIVGVIIIVAAYAISIFVMGKLEQGTISSDGANKLLQTE